MCGNDYFKQNEYNKWLSCSHLWESHRTINVFYLAQKRSAVLKSIQHNDIDIVGSTLHFIKRLCHDIKSYNSSRNKLVFNGKIMLSNVSKKNDKEKIDIQNPFWNWNILELTMPCEKLAVEKFDSFVLRYITWVSFSLLPI